MTAREKLAMEHPGEDIDKLCHDNCPEDYGYLGRFDRCPKVCYEWNAAVVCQRCWDREIPERKQMYSLFLKEFSNACLRYRLLEDKKDLATISERVKRMVISGTPINDLCVVKNVEFEFECALKFKEDE